MVLALGLACAGTSGSIPFESTPPEQIKDSPSGGRIAIHGGQSNAPPGSAMLPLSRPLFDQHAAQLITLAVAAALVSATLVVVAVLTA